MRWRGKIPFLLSKGHLSFTWNRKRPRSLRAAWKTVLARYEVLEWELQSKVEKVGWACQEVLRQDYEWARKQVPPLWSADLICETEIVPPSQAIVRTKWVCKCKMIRSAPGTHAPFILGINEKWKLKCNLWSTTLGQHSQLGDLHTLGPAHKESGGAPNSGVD